MRLHVFNVSRLTIGPIYHGTAIKFDGLSKRDRRQGVERKYGLISINLSIHALNTTFLLILTRAVIGNEYNTERGLGRIVRTWRA